MSILAMGAHLLAERFVRSGVPRRPEERAVMDDPAQNLAYQQAGEGGGILAPVHLYHAIQVAGIAPPGARFLDLACGPGTQLLAIRRLRPDLRCTALDASPEMLARARDTFAAAGIDPPVLAQGDMTKLGGLADASFEAAACTMSLHHLADEFALESAMKALRRVLAAGGAVYLADFGRMRRAATQEYFSRDREAEQGPGFTRDFRASLAAAFRYEELAQAFARLGPRLRVYRTGFAPFLVVGRTIDEAPADPRLAQRIREALADLGPVQREDFRILVRWFRMGGLPLPGVAADAVRER